MTTYQDAGVNMQAGDDLVDYIKPFAKKTMRPEVLAGIGGFGALFKLKNYQAPVLVSGTDGVGTKLKLAFDYDCHDTIGQDLVAMSVNDILVQGAEPLFFLDYFACGKLNVEVAARVIKGIAHACELSGCSLIGGETAEMPGMYPHGEYDLAGFAVGVVEEADIITGKTIQAGDVVLGLQSSGPHSNGYSLIRKILADKNIDLNDTLNDKTLLQHLMAPTHIYVKPCLELMKQVPVKGMAHITGGGLLENIPRILSDDLQAVLYKDNWEHPAIFDFLQAKGQISDFEMHRVFNCGIGMIIVLDAQYAQKAKALLTSMNETVYELGKIKTKVTGEASTIVV